MATYIEELAALTNATTALLSAVNVKKVTLDAAVEDAVAQANLATTNGAAQVVLAADQVELATLQAGLATTNGQSQVSSAAAQVALATTQAQNATNAKDAAAQAKLDAQVYASLAQATNPDSPIRLNPRNITADFAVGSDYNAASVGPISISPGITVTVADNATWSIH